MDSFKYAFRGVGDALKSEPNLKIHFTLGAIAIILGVVLKITFVEWAILMPVIFLVICLELINTIVEKTLDVVSTERSEKIRLIKDMSSAVVLTGALAACFVGAFLFLPKIWALLNI